MRAMISEPFQLDLQGTIFGLFICLLVCARMINSLLCVYSWICKEKRVKIKQNHINTLIEKRLKLKSHEMTFACDSFSNSPIVLEFYIKPGTISLSKWMSMKTNISWDQKSRLLLLHHWMNLTFPNMSPEGIHTWKKAVFHESCTPSTLYQQYFIYEICHPQVPTSEGIHLMLPGVFAQ